MSLTGLYVLDPRVMDQVYGPDQRARIEEHVHFIAEPLSGAELANRPELMRGVDVLFSSWGGPTLDADLLAHADRLKALFYGAGTIKYVMTDAAWERDLLVTTAFAANAVPVAEFTVAQIVMCLKRVWQAALETKRHRRPHRDRSMPGCFGSTVALLSLGAIGRLVAERLRDSSDLRVLAYDPYIPAETAAALGVELVSLEQAFAEADLVSVHTPRLPETEGMIRGEHFRAMKPGASFLNTARGAVVNEPEMIEVLQERPDLWAMLDVTWPEPPAPDSPLWELDNVILTPHIAGSLGSECRRMGSYMADELERYVAGKPLLWRVTREMFARMA